jgi:hypothetical protein
MKKTNLPVTKDQIKDTGMAAVLICLLLEILTLHHQYIILAILLLIVDMVVPIVFKPAAVVWFGISRVLGKVTSRILLTIIFILLVTPMGILRKIFNKDSMQFKKWKQGSSSVFKERHHCFKPEDLETPY